jgi:hypothetical protein
MPTVTGRDAVDRYMAGLPKRITRVLRGAARVAADVVATEVKARAASEEVRDGIEIRTKAEDGTRVVVRITVKKGWARTLGTWQEWGTSPHFITVDDSQRGGRGVKRINSQLRDAKGDASLVINGQFVGKTVFHPGARPEPFMRVSLDLKGDDAIRAAQAHITANLRSRSEA